MDDLDIASVLSLNWKTRLSLCLGDVKASISTTLKRIDILIDKEEDLASIMERLDQLQLLKEEIEEFSDILESEYPLSPLQVETISEFEVEYYSIIMTDENLDILHNEIDEEKEKISQTNQLIERIDQMWDNGDTEEYMKKEIKKFFKDVYDFPEIVLNSFVEQFFNFINGGKNVRVHLSEEQIHNLEKIKFQQDEEETCGICLTPFEKDEEIILLKCKHSYHSNCITPWLKMSVHCPTCRTDLR